MTRRILVTGANKGIGRAIVAAILDAKDDTFVYLGSRDAGRGAAARDALVADHEGRADRIEVVELDVASDASVARAAAQVGDETLYGVVNNAGIGIGDVALRDVLQVNTFGIHRVCQAFLPKLDPAHGRIVNITSASGPNFVSRCSAPQQRFFLDASVTWPQLQAFMEECLGFDGPAAFEKAGLSNGEAYGLSKACANTYTLLLAREHPNLKINACTPGFIATDLTRPYAESSGRSPEEMGMKPPSEGARAPVHLLFGELEGNGRYYGSDAKRSPLDRYRSPGSAPYDGP